MFVIKVSCVILIKIINSIRCQKGSFTSEFFRLTIIGCYLVETYLIVKRLTDQAKAGNLCDGIDNITEPRKLFTLKPIGLNTDIECRFTLMFFLFALPLRAAIAYLLCRYRNGFELYYGRGIYIGSKTRVKDEHRRKTEGFTPA